MVPVLAQAVRRCRSRVKRLVHDEPRSIIALLQPAPHQHGAAAARAPSRCQALAGHCYIPTASCPADRPPTERFCRSARKLQTQNSDHGMLTPARAGEAPRPIIVLSLSTPA